MKRSLAVLAATTIAIPLLATPAAAVEVERRGTCSAGSLWNASVEREFGVYDLDFEIDTRDADSTWNLKVLHNQKQASTRTAKAVLEWDDNYAEVDWSLLRPNRKGTDTFTFRATNATTGETCSTTIKGR